jgi:hypothetical protein
MEARPRDEIHTETSPFYAEQNVIPQTFGPGYLFVLFWPSLMAQASSKPAQSNSKIILWKHGPRMRSIQKHHHFMPNKMLYPKLLGRATFSFYLAVIHGSSQLKATQKAFYGSTAQE